MLRILSLIALLLCISIISAQTTKKDKPVTALSFSSEKELASLTLSNPSEWIISKNGNGGKCLKQLGTNPSPDSTVTSFLLLKEMPASGFILEADIMQTPTKYNLVHIDIIFGYKSDDEYAFAQLASRANRFVHNLFLMNEKTATRVLDKQDRGIEWQFEKWHPIRIERNTNQKTVKVWVDNKLVFESDDSRLMDKGLVGIGNSGDSFKLDNLKLWITE